MRGSLEEKRNRPSHRPRVPRNTCPAYLLLREMMGARILEICTMPWSDGITLHGDNGDRLLVVPLYALSEILTASPFLSSRPKYRKHVFVVIKLPPSVDKINPKWGTIGIADIIITATAAIKSAQRRPRSQFRSLSSSSHPDR